jgi:hypothetical protein
MDLKGKRVEIQIYDDGYKFVIGKFLAIGCDYEEFEYGTGNYSTAIVLLDCGTIKSVHIENVRVLEDDD